MWLALAQKKNSVEDKLREVAEKILHGSDYGNLYWSPSRKAAWWMMGDSDSEEDGCVGGNTIYKALSKVPGVKSVSVEAEAKPPESEGYHEIEFKSRETKVDYEEARSMGNMLDVDWRDIKFVEWRLGLDEESGRKDPSEVAREVLQKLRHNPKFYSHQLIGE